MLLWPIIIMAYHDGFGQCDFLDAQFLQLATLYAQNQDCGNRPCPCPQAPHDPPSRFPLMPCPPPWLHACHFPQLSSTIPTFFLQILGKNGGDRWGDDLNTTMPSVAYECLNKQLNHGVHYNRHVLLKHLHLGAKWFNILQSKAWGRHSSKIRHYIPPEIDDIKINKSFQKLRSK